MNDDPAREPWSGWPLVPRVPIALALAVRGGLVLVMRRSERRHAGGVWEFPGGKVETGELPDDAARRELLEETGLRAATLEPLTVAVFDYPDRLLRFHAFLAPEPVGDIVIEDGAEYAWCVPADLRAEQFPPANGPILRALRWRLDGRR